MNNGTFFTLALAVLLAGGCASPLLADAVSSSASALAPEDWGDCEALQKRLAARILENLRGAEGAAAVCKVLSRPENRLLLAQWHVAHCEGAVNTSEHAPAGAGETMSPRSLKELLASADAGTRAFIRKLTNNGEWMAQLAYTGEWVRPGCAMAVLDAIRKERAKKGKPAMESDRVLRDIATATALEWARSGWDFNKGLACARFYMENSE